MKAVPFGPQDGAKFNIAVQRPSVNVKEAENVGEQAQAAAHLTPRVTFSRHGTFGPRAVTHPGLENL